MQRTKQTSVLGYKGSALSLVIHPFPFPNPASTSSLLQDQTRSQQQAGAAVASKRRGLTEDQERKLLRRAAALQIHVSPYLRHKRGPAEQEAAAEDSK
jgi:hypothetical protein